MSPSPNKAKGIDFQRLAQDFKGLDPNDPGVWPLAPRIVVLVVLFVAIVAAAWWFDWQDQVDELKKREAEELQLRQTWISKKKLAINLEDYRRQLAEIDRQFGALLKQLPNKAEMDSLLSDINQAGLGRGLQFDLFRPGSETVKDFYAEMPIAISVVASYHDLGAFAADVAKMPRIVILDGVKLQGQSNGLLKLDAQAVTYRYLDEEELAQRPANKKGK
jgi:type IV pilus assembly protein PilO